MDFKEFFGEDNIETLLNRVFNNKMPRLIKMSQELSNHKSLIYGLNNQINQRLAGMSQQWRYELSNILKSIYSGNISSTAAKKLLDSLLQKWKQKIDALDKGTLY